MALVGKGGILTRTGLLREKGKPGDGTYLRPGLEREEEMLLFMTYILASTRYRAAWRLV